MSRPITFAQARALFPHRFTMQHVPDWARKQRPDGTFYAPQYRSDAEWYTLTRFNGESELADRKSCYSIGQTWPLGQSLQAPYRAS